MRAKAWKLVGQGGHVRAGEMSQEEIDRLIADGYQVTINDSPTTLGEFTMSDGATFSAKSIRDNEIKKRKLAEVRRKREELEKQQAKETRERLLPKAEGLAILLRKGLPTAMSDSIDALDVINLLREEFSLEFECTRYTNERGDKRIRLNPPA